MATAIVIGFALLMLAGFAFIALGLPGVPYIFVVAALYEIADRFQRLSGGELAILGGIAVASIAIDQLAGILGARWGGARGKSFLYGLAGLILGNIVAPVIGGFIGLFVGVLIGEVVRRRKHEPEAPDQVKNSAKAAVSSVLGAAAGMVINLCLAALSIVLFLVFVLYK